MRFTHIVLAGSAALVLAGCAGGGPFQRQRPDEFAVACNAPLVVPPDFALAPPRPGQPDAGAGPARVEDGRRRWTGELDGGDAVECIDRGLEAVVRCGPGRGLPCGLPDPLEGALDVGAEVFEC